MRNDKIPIVRMNLTLVIFFGNSFDRFCTYPNSRDLNFDL